MGKRGEEQQEFSGLEGRSFKHLVFSSVPAQITRFSGANIKTSRDKINLSCKKSGKMLLFGKGQCLGEVMEGRGAPGILEYLISAVGYLGAFTLFKSNEVGHLDGAVG